MDSTTNEGRVITIGDLLGIFIHRLWILILVPAVVVAGLFIYKTQTFVPEYESTATLYILKEATDSNTVLSSQDFSLALNVVNDCTYFLKSHSVVDETISNLDLDMSYGELSGRISTANPTDTRFLTVTVRASSPEDAKLIVDEICEIGARDISETMGFQQVNVYEKGIVNTVPCNQTGLTTYALVGMAIVVAIYAVFLVLFMLDDKIKGEEDIIRHLGLSVLGEIPNTESTKGRGGKYSKYGRYGEKTRYVTQEESDSKDNAKK